VKNTVSFLDFEGQGDHPQYKLQFQPTLPTLLTPDLKLILRPEFTLVDETPYENAQDEVVSTTGVGDTILDVVLSPVSDPWLLWLGPTFVFPTANLDQTGQGKWQAGPAGVFGYRAKTWLALLIAQQWWSFAGSASRPPVTELHLQYIASYFLAGGWSVGTSPTIKVNWRAASGERVTFPFGPCIGKVIKLGGTLPVKFELEGLYAPVHPNQGEQFIVQVNIIPVVPAPLPEPLFGRNRWVALNSPSSSTDSRAP